ncbi:MAG TPA: hypothetical protein PLB92_07225, partial [Rhodoglobus sp.]|nr:hypothetical protein [Rhodoglobus sp.]
MVASDIVLLLSGWARQLRQQTRGVVKVGEGCGVEGLEAAALRRGEVVGEREGGEVVEGAADLLEAALELDGAGRDGAWRWLGAQSAERIAQQFSTVGLVGAAEELDQTQGLAPGRPTRSA